MKKIRKGDQVILIAGKDKGKTGEVSSVYEDKVLVDGLNLAKKHVKPNPNLNEKGGIVTKEMPVNLSNVAILNPASNKPDRIGFKFNDEGKKVRFFKSDGSYVK